MSCGRLHEDGLEGGGMAEEVSGGGRQALENVMKQLQHLPSFDDFIMLRRPNDEKVVFEARAFDEEAWKLVQNHAVTVTFIDKAVLLDGHPRPESAAINTREASPPK